MIPCTFYAGNQLCVFHFLQDISFFPSQPPSLLYGHGHFLCSTSCTISNGHLANMPVVRGSLSCHSTGVRPGSTLRCVVSVCMSLGWGEDTNRSAFTVSSYCELPMFQQWFKITDIQKSSVHPWDSYLDAKPEEEELCADTVRVLGKDDLINENQATQMPW